MGPTGPPGPPGLPGEIGLPVSIRFFEKFNFKKLIYTIIIE
jgi:hypothetical protein